MRKKIGIILILFLILTPFQVGANSKLENLNEEIKIIENKIKELREKLEKIKNQKNNFYFTTKLKKGDKGEEVRELQKFLNNNLENKIAKKGPGSLGNETFYFGELTQKALIRFQEKHKEEILDPWGFNKGTGIVGVTTRIKINKLLHKKEIKESSFSISSKVLKQGDSAVLKIKNSNPDEKIIVKFADKEIKFYQLNTKNEKAAFLPIGANYTPSFYPLVIDSDKRGYYFDYLVVEESNFPQTTLKVTPELEEKGYNPDMIQENVAKENKLLFNEVFNQEPTNFYFKDNFTNPLDKIKNVGAYGNLRVNGNIKLRHLGIDLEANENKPVYSINDGVVVFAREITDYGKTIVINHGGGIHSLYLHLNEFLVKKGEEVKKGDKIALSGNTGYSIAPHLHLSINVHGESIDPLKFLKLNI
ncbi:MAG: peptidoglycan DD-metalloendopeptidase family protein [Minisyncoccales bacterium]